MKKLIIIFALCLCLVHNPIIYGQTIENATQGEIEANLEDSNWYEEKVEPILVASGISGTTAITILLFILRKNGVATKTLVDANSIIQKAMQKIVDTETEYNKKILEVENIKQEILDAERRREAAEITRQNMFNEALTRLEDKQNTILQNQIMIATNDPELVRKGIAAKIVRSKDDKQV